MTTKTVINIKYNNSDKDFLNELVYKLNTVFDSNSIFNTCIWGEGFYTTNFCYDDRYIYCDVMSDLYLSDSFFYQTSESYIQGFISGYLRANGLNIL